MRTSFSIPPPPPAAQASKKSRRARLPDGAAGEPSSERVAECASGPVPVECLRPAQGASKVRARRHTAQAHWRRCT